MEIADLRNKTKVELEEELHALLQEQFNLRMQKAAGQAQKPHLHKEVRRNVARVKTVLREKAVNDD